MNSKKNTIKKCIVACLLMISIIITGVPFLIDDALLMETKGEPVGITGTNNVGEAPDVLSQSGEWLYYIYEDFAVIAGYTNKKEIALTIPFSLDGHSVRGIGANAFANMADLTSVTCHSLITNISDQAFTGSSSEIRTYSGAFALQYAHSNTIPVQNITNSNEMYDFRETVVDFSGFPKKYYQVNADNTVRISKDIADLLSLGTIIYIPGYSTEYHLFAYEVANIVEQKGIFTLHTCAIEGLGSVLDCMVFKDQELWMDTSGVVALSEGVVVENVESAITVSNGFENKVTTSIEIPLGEGVTLSGKIGTKISGSASIEVTTNPLPSITRNKTNFSQSVEYELSASGKISKKETKVKLFKVPVRGGPFSFWFTVEMSIDLKGSIKVSGGFTDTISITKEANQDWKVKQNFQKDKPKVEISVAVEVGWPIEAYGELGLSIGKSGLALKFVSLKITPSISATGKTVLNQATPLQCIDISVSVDGKLSASVGILKVTLGSRNWSNLLKTEYSTKVNILKFSFHLDNTAEGLHYQYVDKCRVKGRTLIFHQNNGGSDRYITVDAGQLINEPQPPVKDGFIFGGWYFSPSDSGFNGKAYKWNFKKFRLPYLNWESAHYCFFAKWLVPGQTPEPDSEEQPQGPIYGGFGGYSWEPDPPKPVEVTDIQLNRIDEVLHVDGEHKDKLYLYATITPANADDTSVTWSSSNPSVASVDSSGVVSAHAQGETIITCQSNMTPSVSTTCKITVFQPIYVRSITLDRTNIELWANEEENSVIRLNAAVDPTNATYSSVHWESSNEDVAWVDGWGNVTAMSAGTATITCKSVKNQEVKATCEVTVHQHVRNVFVSLGKQGLLPGETVQLAAFCYPTNADNRKVLWSSSDETVASVDLNGVVTARGYGETVITATAVDGSNIYGSQSISVEHELTLIANSKNNMLYIDGNSGAAIGYAYATQGSVRRMVERGYDLEWSFQGGEDTIADAYLDIVSSVYTIGNKDYEIPAAVLYCDKLHNVGTASFTLLCKAGPYTETIDLQMTVSDKKLAKEVTINPTKYELEINEDAYIPRVPTARDDGEVPAILDISLTGDAYYRSNAYVSADDKGIYVHFAKSGQYSANIIYKSANVVYTVPITFEVKDENGIMHLPVSNVALNDNFVNLVEGETYCLTASVDPSDAFDNTVTWTSDDETIATVSQNGEVKAKSCGMVYIRCEANDGSGMYDSCVLNVEPFVALTDPSIVRTIYMDGQTHATIASCNLTYYSSLRLEEQEITPNWTLSKISGNSTEVALKEVVSSSDGFVQIRGVDLVLLRTSKVGVDKYRLICEAGEHLAVCDIELRVEGTGNLPETLVLKTDHYETQIENSIEIDPSVECFPDGSSLPNDTQISIEPSRAFWNALEENTYFGDGTCIFAKGGEYSANLVFSGANYRYSVPFTVSVKGGNGIVPVTLQEIRLSRQDLQLLNGEVVQLDAVTLPENVDTSRVVWSSFDSSVATVSADGKVTAIGEGITYILASIEQSGLSTLCTVVVEDGLTLENDFLTKTVFTDGTTRTCLDTVFLTESSSKRLGKAPEWKLQRVSGNNLTLRVEDTESVDEEGETLFGCRIQLHSVSSLGQTVYDLTCSADDECATMRIVVNAKDREGNLPSSIEINPAKYEAEVDELIVINPETTCWPQGTELPDGTRVEIVGEKQFLDAVNQEDWFTSRSISSLSFKEAGRFEAYYTYSYSNISYSIPIVFNIRDDNGNVPIHATQMKLNTSSLQMEVEEEKKVEAVFTPADLSDNSVTWESTNTAVATVNQDGLIKAKANGTAQIICTPSDTHCKPSVCFVTVEDYLTIQTGNSDFFCYLEGNQKNLLASAWLTEGTAQRLARDGIVPSWKLITDTNSSAVVVGKPDKEGRSIQVETISLEFEGITHYTIVCEAGPYRWSEDYQITVSSADTLLPDEVSMDTPEVEMLVGERKTINFTPVCKPTGTSLPTGINSTYVGFGDFYEALDHSVYERDGDSVTLAFTRPGRYLLARVYKVKNIDYSIICTINVGISDERNLGLLKATEKECLVYVNGKSGGVSTISIYDSTVYERFKDKVQWNVERLSGESVSAGLISSGSTVTLYVADVEKTGTDIWRVSCSFGDISDYVDIAIEAKEARKPLPTSLMLSKERLIGVTGDWLYLPLGVSCLPEGSSLPEIGDDFWAFKWMGGLAEDTADNEIKDGMLRVCFYESGYYTGILEYKAGNVSFKLPVYFTVYDEENQIHIPEQLKVWLLSESNTVYPEGEVNIPIATAVIAENLNSYYSGIAPSYANASGIQWDISVTSGDAAQLGIQRHDENSADIILTSMKGAGDITYVVSCIIDGVTYETEGHIHVASSSEERPDVTLIQSRYEIMQGVPFEFSRSLYQRSNGCMLQSADEWQLGDALAAIGYSYETSDSEWTATFYKSGEYKTIVTAHIGNLRFDLPLTVIVLKEESKDLRTITVPTALTKIDDEAFSGLTIQVVDLRGSNISTIGRGAFSNCVDLLDVYIPSSVNNISDTAFYGCLNMTVHCVEGSYTDRFAQSKGLNVIYDIN